MKIPSSSASRWTAAVRVLASTAARSRYALDLPGSIQRLANHPQIGQRKLRLDLGRVLLQTAVPRLQISELTLQNSERMLHLRSHLRFQPFDLLVDPVEPLALVQLAPLARPHRNVPRDRSRFASLLDALIARIGKGNLLLAVQQRMRHRDVMNVRRRALHAV